MPSLRATIFQKNTAALVPPLVSWILTKRCNMRCIHCYTCAGPAYRGKELNLAQQKEIIKQLADDGVQGIFLSGGEALLLPHLFCLVDSIQKLGMACWICTNGTLIDDNMSRKLASLGVAGVSVSVDSSESTVHDRFRLHAGAHFQALRAIESLAEKGVTINVDCTITKLNNDKLTELHTMVDSLGVKSVFFKRFRPLGRGFENRKKLALSKKNYFDAIVKLLEFHNYRAKGTEISFEDPSIYAYYRKQQRQDKLKMNGLYSQYGCLAGVAWLGIQPNGDITPCPLLKISIGNITRTSLESAVMHSDKIRRIVNRDDRTGHCRTCDQRWQCGGCRAHAFTKGGDYLAEDPFCIYSFSERSIR